MSAHSYPVRVDATLQEGLSRWLWLVKWLLAIPHYLVLVLLWPVFAVLSIVALVAILFTGRYPRPIFDLNVGILRWSWRVAYYAYGGLGTDEYPPFSLEEKPDYPAHLEIAYPEHLSRGLVLVKWWLLALPHYLVIAFFLGTGFYVGSRDDVVPGPWSGGLIGLLVLIAAVTLLVTGSYPRSLFDLVLGMNRWALRVAAYAGLMTDEYPPFRMDLGGTDPGTGLLEMGVQTAPAPAPAAPPPGEKFGAGRIVAAIAGSLLVLTSMGMLAGGGALRLMDSSLRDADGYLMSSSASYESPGYAVQTRNFVIDNGSARLDLPQRWLGTIKVTADARTPNGVFVGVARTDDVREYLRGVAHSTIADPFDDSGTPTSTFVDGGSPRVVPNHASFWSESAYGQGRQTITWEPRAGDWTLVVMNGEGTTPVAADVAVGATVPILGELVVGLLIGGSTLLVGSGVLLWAALHRRRGPTS